MTINDIVTLLNNNDNFTILVHHSPDGDCLGSAFALAGALQIINKNARVLCDEEIPSKYDFLQKTIVHQNFSEEFIITVDVADSSLLGALKNEYENKINLVIDHHLKNSLKCDLKYVESDSASTAEIIYLIICELLGELPQSLADCIYTGISTDTGSFKYPSVTARTHLIAADLLKKNCNHAYISKVMFDTNTKSQIALKKAVLDQMEFYFNDLFTVVILTKDIIKETKAQGSDFDGIANIGRNIENVIISVVLKEVDDGFKASIRSDSIIDSSKIAAEFGGGGHKEAAGCFIKDSKKTAIKKICDIVEKTLIFKGLYNK